jgi:hypothetical protein
VARVQLFYYDRDDKTHESRGSQILYWLDDLGARPLTEATSDDHGFLFAGARSNDDYRRLVAPYLFLADRPAAREPLLDLASVLDALADAEIDIPTPRTWRLELDADLPGDLRYPLFLRTSRSSLKLGGVTSRVRDRKELEAEAAELRRLLGWDATILAREWHDLAQAGESSCGAVPQEVRVWIVDRQPFAWSFHYLNLVAAPKGFPPSADHLCVMRDWSERIGSAFASRCVVADFARKKNGQWLLIEAGPGSCAGTAHEQVFKAVAQKLIGRTVNPFGDDVGGLF